MKPGINQAFEDQAFWCKKLGSPFMARLMRLLPGLLQPKSALGQKILTWPGDPGPKGDILPLRLAGGLHALVISGQCPELAAAYPPHQPDQLEAGLNHAFNAHEAWLLSWLDQPPQTNEVGRSAVLYPGLCEITRLTGLALDLYEPAASAGLNLSLDHYTYDFSGNIKGNPASPLILAPEWQGAALKASAPTIKRRAGCDSYPIDLEDPKARLRLQSYTWPDQYQRLDRLLKAIDVTRNLNIKIDQADATSWLQEKLAKPVTPQTCRVVMHSISFQYFSPSTASLMQSVMEEAGGKAKRDRPLAWLCFEMKSPFEVKRADQHTNPGLFLKIWPEGKSFHLATATPHGDQVTSYFPS